MNSDSLSPTKKKGAKKLPSLIFKTELTTYDLGGSTLLT
jgi:hypothetical protein